MRSTIANAIIAPVDEDMWIDVTLETPTQSPDAKAFFERPE